MSLDSECPEPPGIGDPGATAPHSPCCPTTTQAPLAPLMFQGGRTGRVTAQGRPRPRITLKGPTKTLGHTLRLPSTLIQPTPQLPAEPSAQACWPPVGNSNPRSVLKGPSPVAWHHIAGDWRPRNHSARLTLLPGRHPGLSGSLCSFRVGE